jgi:hypothetical protein
MRLLLLNRTEHGARSRVVGRNFQSGFGFVLRFDHLALRCQRAGQVDMKFRVRRQNANGIVKLFDGWRLLLLCLLLLTREWRRLLWQCLRLLHQDGPVFRHGQFAVERRYTFAGFYASHRAYGH